MPRGRPLKSTVRQNIIEILSHKSAYGYELYKYYRDLFPDVTMRNIYYHLKKGLETGEIRIERVEKQQGSYSWGAEVERTYYAIGEKAQPKGDLRVKKYFESKGK
jgi:DNA-binding PadR family transcriptional regulator